MSGNTKYTNQKLRISNVCSKFNDIIFIAVYETGCTFCCNYSVTGQVSISHVLIIPDSEVLQWVGWIIFGRVSFCTEV